MRYPLLIAALLLLGGPSAVPAPVDSLDGLWEGFDGEWRHVSNQLVALAEAIPADKFAWRPSAGVRSTSEVFLHISMANFSLMIPVGAPPIPAELRSLTAERTITNKADVVRWLRQSLDLVKTAHAAAKPADLARKLKYEGRDSSVDSMYLRIIVHANEHMGQLIAYARMSGVTPPWSEGAK